ncbi:Methyltransferase domain, partial [Rhizoctonia solani]
MSARVWDDETEAEVWIVEPGFLDKDPSLDDLYSSDSETTISSTDTIQSIDAPDYFRVSHGRAFPIYDDLPMALPADQGEIYRLRLQHMAIKKLVGKALDSIIEVHLTPSPDGRRKRILDVRTQSGLWADEMAIKYPTVDVKSIDVVPTVAHYPRHNLHYEVYDIHAGILEPTGTFDIVHARHSVSMVKGWTSLLQEIHRVLRPGGLLIFGEFDPRLTLPGEHEPAFHGLSHNTARFCEAYRSALAKGGVLIEAFSEIDAWLCPGSGLWDTKTPSGFHQTNHRVWEVPMSGLWHPDPEMQEIGMLMAMNFRQFIINAQPLFLSYETPQGDYDGWVEEVKREIRDPMNSTLIRYHSVTALKL